MKDDQKLAILLDLKYQHQQYYHVPRVMSEVLERCKKNEAIKA